MRSIRRHSLSVSAEAEPAWSRLLTSTSQPCSSCYSILRCPDARHPVPVCLTMKDYCTFYWTVAVCAQGLVMLVTLHLAIRVPFRGVAGPRCSASWPVRTRRITFRRILHCCSSWTRLSCLLCATTGALVTGCRKLRIFRSCSSSSMVVDFLVVVHRSIPMVLTVQQTIETPQLQFLVHVSRHAPGLLIVTGFSARGAEAVSHGPDLFCARQSALILDAAVHGGRCALVAQVVQFIPVVAQRLCSHGLRLFSWTTEIPLVAVH